MVFSEAARKSFSAVMQCRESGDGLDLRAAMIFSKCALRSGAADSWCRISPIVSGRPALGVTIYRLFTGRFPYGEIEPFTHPKFRSPSPLANYRPDLPAWLDKVIGRAISVNPADRYQDVLELVFEVEHGADRASP